MNRKMQRAGSYTKLGRSEYGSGFPRHSPGEFLRVWRKLQTRMDEEEVANMTSDFQHKSGSAGVKYTIQP